MFLTADNKELEQLKQRCLYKKHFQFYNVSLTLLSDNNHVLEIFDTMYHTFNICVHHAEPIECYIIERASEQGPAVIIGTKIYKLFEGELFISHAHMIVFQYVINNIDGYFLLHAGVVAKNNYGVIISGPSGYGKTTLMLELVSRGYKFFSDEFCPVNLNDFTVEAFPRSLGMRESSPFMQAISNEQHLLLKNIGRGSKYLINCNELFPDSIGSKCTAKHLIFLRGNKSECTENNQIFIDLALYNNNQELIDNICKYPGIKLIDFISEDKYVIYRISIASHIGATERFYQFCSQYEDEIFYQEQIAQVKPDFTSLPEIHEISKTEALISLIKNIRNRSRHSRLLAGFNNKHLGLLLTIGKFIKNIKCYQMQIGPLTNMADLIEHL